MICAHTPNPGGQWHDLVEHLQAVARLAEEFAGGFEAGAPARYLGLWHDLGKFDPAFQDYLRRCAADPKAKGRGPDHKAAGAELAVQHLGKHIALLVQGHHGGLQTPTDFKSWLAERTKEPVVAAALAQARGTIPALEPDGLVPVPAHVERDARAAELFLRLLFSALVDADYLDTERHFDTARATQRGGDVPLAALWERFAADQAQFLPPRADPVSQARHAIYQGCLAAAEQRPGLFRLAVPTGGGKTRSAMAFALRHALRHDQRRVIVAVPFISITEQTASVYREIFERDGDDQPVVLEHHSAAFADGAQAEDFHRERVWERLAAENWDAPIVVTTTVQLFESLFANTTSRCRKLHRLARSVIILDEAQALPPHLLKPILDALEQLCRHYGTSVVLSTATQPAFEAISEFRDLARTAREIVREPTRWFRALERVNYAWQTDQAKTWDEVAALLRESPQALAVVNTKQDALDLLAALDDPAALHLSTLLCGAHRRFVINKVRRRLKKGEPCRLVSTQVIEAGVDLDFPRVLRALGPLDGIIQAAGRCNREGDLPGKGQVIVFRPVEERLPQGAYLIGTKITSGLISRNDFDPNDPRLVQRYFRDLFNTVGGDRELIQQHREAFHFPEVASRFRLIKEKTMNVVITRYGPEKERAQVQEWIAQLRQGTPRARDVLRQLQPYLVALRQQSAAQYQRQGLIMDIQTGLGEWCGGYDEEVIGLMGRDLRADDLSI